MMSDGGMAQAGELLTEVVILSPICSQVINKLFTIYLLLLIFDCYLIKCVFEVIPIPYSQLLLNGCIRFLRMASRG